MYVSVSFLQNDRFISYLPLSHVAAQMMDIHAPLHAGFTVWFAPPDALRSNSFLITLRVSYRWLTDQHAQSLLCPPLPDPLPFIIQCCSGGETNCVLWSSACVGEVQREG